MAKAQRPVHVAYDVKDVNKGRDPFAGKPYSKIYPDGEVLPTHPMMKVPGTARAVWFRDLGRWVV